MTAVVLALVFSVASAMSYAAAAVIQQRVAANGAAAGIARVLQLLRHSRWRLAVVLNCAGALLHVVALGYGPLTLVQPLGILTLLLALPLGAARGGRRVRPAEWRGAAMCALGLTGLVLVTASESAARGLGGSAAPVVSLATCALLVALVGGALMATGPRWRSLAYAAAAGLAFGIASVLAQSLVVRADVGLAVLVSPTTIVVLALAVAGLVLSQLAYRGSGVGAPLATATLINPIAAAAVGIGLLGERFAGGAVGTVVAAIAALLAAYGVIVLSRPADPTSTPPPSEPAMSPPDAAAVRAAG